MVLKEVVDSACKEVAAVLVDVRFSLLVQCLTTFLHNSMHNLLANVHFLHFLESHKSHDLIKELHLALLQNLMLKRQKQAVFPALELKPLSS